MRAFLATHRSKMVRHCPEGTDVEHFEEPTLTLEGDEADISSLRTVTVGEQEIGLDWDRQTAAHRTHSDPLVILEDDDGTMRLQLFLCGHMPEARQITVAGDRGRASLTARQLPMTATPSLDTACRRTSEGWRLDYRTDEQVQIILQTRRQGREEEAILHEASGVGSILIPPTFADRLGVAVTTSDIYGGLEHKHILHGEAGHPSGRRLLAGSRLFEPDLIKLPGYLSVILLASDYDSRTLAILREVDEITVFGTPDDVERVWASVERAGRPMIAWTCGDTPSDHIDVLRVDPTTAWLPKWDGATSFAIGCDQARDGFLDRLRAGLVLLKRGAYGINLIESAWADQVHHRWAMHPMKYGIGFSHSSADGRHSKVEAEKLKALAASDQVGGLVSMAAFPLARGLAKRLIARRPA